MTKMETTVKIAQRRPRVGRHRSTRPRTLHLVDLENLLAGRVIGEDVADVWAEYSRVTALHRDDHVVVSVAKRHAEAAFFALPGVQRVIGADGPDGADIALIDAVPIGWAASRFAQVMLASGDHIFGDIASRLRAEGLPVALVIGAGTAAYELYLRCDSQLYLPQAQRRAQRAAQRLLDRKSAFERMRSSVEQSREPADGTSDPDHSNE